MAAKTFKLDVVTPDKLAFSEKAIVSVVIPGSEGYFGVMAGHAPLMTKMAIGELSYTREDGEKGVIFINGGFVEVFENTVTVLAHTAELGKDIDLERAKEALDRARERLKTPGSDTDLAQAEAALQRAMARISVANRHKSIG